MAALIIFQMIQKMLMAEAREKAVTWLLKRCFSRELKKVGKLRKKSILTSKTFAIFLQSLLAKSHLQIDGNWYAIIIKLSSDISLLCKAFHTAIECYGAIEDTQIIVPQSTVGRLFTNHCISTNHYYIPSLW